MQSRCPDDAARYAVEARRVDLVSVAQTGNGDAQHAPTFPIAELHLERPAAAAARFRLHERDTRAATVQRRGRHVSQRLALFIQRNAADLRINVRLACTVPRLAAVVEIILD